MSSKLKCVMLIDDNPDDNFFHSREIKKGNIFDTIITKTNANEALDYLSSADINGEILPDLILLDINMPGMNGWDFLHAYNNLEQSLKTKVIIIMLTTSENPDDKAKALKWNFISDYRSKPLTTKMIEEITSKYFGT